MTLFRQQVKTEWVSVLTWSLIFAVLIFYMVILWQQMNVSGTVAQLQQMLNQMSPALRSVYGAGLALGTLPGWIEGYLLGGWINLVFLVFTGLFVAGIVTREMDRRTMEFLLSLPVSRTQFIVSRWLGMALALGILHLAHYGGIAAAVAVVGQQVPMGRVLLAEFNSLLLFLALGSVLLVVSLFVDDYGRGVGAVLGLGIGLYFFYLGAENSTGFTKTLRTALPFARFDQVAIIEQGTVPTGDLLVLGAIAAVGLALSVLIFRRKQIAV